MIPFVANLYRSTILEPNCPPRNADSRVVASAMLTCYPGSRVATENFFCCTTSQGEHLGSNFCTVRCPIEINARLSTVPYIVVIPVTTCCELTMVFWNATFLKDQEQLSISYTTRRSKQRRSLAVFRGTAATNAASVCYHNRGSSRDSISNSLVPVVDCHLAV